MKFYSILRISPILLFSRSFYCGLSCIPWFVFLSDCASKPWPKGFDLRTWGI